LRAAAALDMLAMLTTVLPGTTPPYPFPQDCSNVNVTTGAPGWFSNCTDAAGGCFKISVPKETKYNIGNTTFGASKAGGTQWCIDHLQGFVYSKVIDPAGAMYYEVDDRSGTGTAPQCRFLTGFDGRDEKQKAVYRARAYNPAGLECILTDEGGQYGIHAYSLAVNKTTPPLFVPSVAPDQCPTGTSCACQQSTGTLCGPYNYRCC